MVRVKLGLELCSGKTMVRVPLGLALGLGV